MPPPAMTTMSRTFSILQPQFLLIAAAGFAVGAHAAIDHRRKYTGEPYEVHLVNVVGILEKAGYGGDKEMLAAAYLHDTVEDTSITVDIIRESFGDDVADLVDALTDPVVVANRAMRKEAAREKIAAASSRAQTIKVADLIDNSASIIANDPKFAKIYIAEKRLLLNRLTKADAALLARAERIVRTYEIDNNQENPR